MYMNNFRRFIILIGLTLTLLVGNFTSPVFAQPAPAQQEAPIGVTVSESPGIIVAIYNFPAEDITYDSKEGTLSYNGRTYTGSAVQIVNSEIGKQISVNVPTPNLLESKKFTLLLPNNTFNNGEKITAVGITVTTLVRVVPPRVVKYNLRSPPRYSHRMSRDDFPILCKSSLSTIPSAWVYV